MVAIQPDDIDMVCNPVGCPEAAGATVTVNVRGDFRLITPILAFVFGGQDLELASSATAQIEYFPDINLITPPPGPIAEFTAQPDDSRSGPVGHVRPEPLDRQPDRLPVGLQRRRRHRLDRAKSDPRLPDGRHLHRHA